MWVLVLLFAVRNAIELVCGDQVVFLALEALSGALRAVDHAVIDVGAHPNAGTVICDLVGRVAQQAEGRVEMHHALENLEVAGALVGKERVLALHALVIEDLFAEGVELQNLRSACFFHQKPVPLALVAAQIVALGTSDAAALVVYLLAK